MTRPIPWKRKSVKAISEQDRAAAVVAPAFAGRDQLCVLTCGSVDDGKSTLIGRLLLDASLVFDDHVAALKRDSTTHGTVAGDVDPALLVDGLEAEREQGITIDVAYRYFGTPAALHRRRYAGAQRLHAQHGDRRIDIGSRDSAG